MKKTKRIVDKAAFSWVGPVFFVDLGAKIIFDADLFVTVVPYAILLFVAIFVIPDQYGWYCGSIYGKHDLAQSLMIGFGMLGRG